MSGKGLTIAILNLMPTKEATANQLTTLISGEEEVDVVLLYPESHYQSKGLPELLARAYFPFSLLEERHFDGVIITGAPVEQLAFEDVDYWQELCQALRLIKAKSIPLLAICWGAQAALYHYYQIEKRMLRKKVIGVFEHHVQVKTGVFQALATPFNAPHSRYTTVDEAQVMAHPRLLNVADSAEAGLYLVTDETERETFVFGHAEYGCETLDLEYQRDLILNKEAPFPKHYYPNDQTNLSPDKTWEEHGQSLFNQWVASLKASTILP